MERARLHLIARVPWWAATSAVVALVLVCYWPAMHGALLWDDPAHVTRPELRGWDGLVRIWTDVRATQQYYPVLFTAFWVQHRLWGDAVFGYHLTNALFHAANCCLLGALVFRLWRERTGASEVGARLAAGFAAVLFAVHPVSVESVAWITELKNGLSTFLYLLSAHAYLMWQTARRPGVYLLAAAFFVLALGAKSVTATLPAALLVLEWWRRGRVAWRRDGVALLPWFLIAGAAGLTTVWLERHHIGAEGAAFALTPFERLVLAGRVVWFYLGKLLWPGELAFFYPRWDVPALALTWVPFLMGTLLVTVLFWLIRRRARGPLAAWLLYVGGLFPALGFFNVYPFLFSYVADHFQYLASVSAFGAVGCFLAWLQARMHVSRTPALAGAGLLIACLLAGVSRQQSALYRDNETLFRDNIAKVPDSWMAHHILAHTLSKTEGREAEAAHHFREALRHNPGFPDAHLGLGVVLSRSPTTAAEAMAEYERAIALRPHYVEAHNNLGFLLSTVPGRQADAERHLREASRLHPGFLAPRLTLARLLARQPTRRAEAIEAFEAVLRLDRNAAEAHHALGILFMQTPGRRQDALDHFETAVRLEPANVVALNSLGLASAEMGRFDRARECWQRALALDPGSEEARQNLQRLQQLGAGAR